LACSAGDPQAIAALRTFEPNIRAAFRRLRLDEAAVDDLVQELYSRLLIGGPDGVPKLMSYAGRGSLKSWLRSAATRYGLNFLDSHRQPAPLTETVLLGLRTTGDPELDLLKQKYREYFKDAVATALRSLPTRDRTLLAQYFIDGLTVDELAAIHDTHRATAARWVARAREAVFEETMAQLRTTLRVERNELDSILRLINSQLEASMGALLVSL
jgi:RNA polymerase sigma-70 factor (ECF subfamily)